MGGAAGPAPRENDGRGRDPAWAARWLGPYLLATLESLGATPAARAKLRNDPALQPPGRLDQLRMARRQGTPGA